MSTTGYFKERPQRWDDANAGWAEAVRVYRASVDIYRHALVLRSKREASRGQLSIVLRPAAVHGRKDLDGRQPSASPLTATVALSALTAREREVAVLIASGYSNQQIAERLVLTRGTVANHVAHILGKLGVANRTSVAAMVFQGVASAN